MIYYTTEPPIDSEVHPYWNRWKFGACDILDVDTRGISIVRNIPDENFPVLKKMLDPAIEIKLLDRATFEDMVENSLPK